MAIYPAVIPTNTDYPNRTDDIDWLYAARYNEIKNEVIAICVELGINPKGGATTVVARLALLALKSNVLELNNTTPFTPDADYEPATKKYVDDNAGIPSGLILMWSGAISAIPAGWVICNGANGTPNLTDRFVIHADADSGGSNNPGDSGGAKTVSLSVANLPAHTHGSAGAHAHTYPGFTNSYQSGGDGDLDDITGGSKNTGSGGAHTHSSVGSGSAHSNRDKYYALAYIMKT